MLTVSIPVWRTPVALLERAVESVLSNDSVSRVVVTGDGEPVDWWSEDPRVVVWTVTDNRGRYFIDDVVSRACSTEHFTAHDADDWSDPGRLDALVAASVDAAFSNRTRLDRFGDRATYPLRPHRRGKRDGMWGVMGVFRKDAIEGLFHPGYRVAWDDIISEVAHRHLHRAFVASHAYHIEPRPESLTTARSTGMASEYRRAVIGPQVRLWSVLDRAASLDDVKRLITDTIHPCVASARDVEVDRLRSRL